MDTSDRYIEMCEKAVEIQESWKPAWGDFVADSDEQQKKEYIKDLKKEKKKKHNNPDPPKYP